MVLRKIRITLASVMFIGLTLLFLDFTGALHAYLGWMAKVQFIPAMLQATVAGAAICVFIIAMTLVFGRIYCSVICPLGILQDIIARIGRIGRRNPYSFSKNKTILRSCVLVAFGGAIVAGGTVVAGLIEPYSIFGRITSSIMAPAYDFINNMFAKAAERADSYMFYTTEVRIQAMLTLIIASVTLLILIILAARNGRTWCNTICPIGTFLGFIAKYSRLKVVINEDACKNCGKCAKNCKAACIDTKNHTVDYSRCVVCGDCLNQCSFGAIAYGHKATIDKENALVKDKAGNSRRSFLLSMAMATTAAALAQEKKKVDGGLAEIKDKQAPERKTPITPPGSISARHLAQHCTACQLCITACPNHVLKPSTNLDTLMQPYMTYEDGYCRPECNRCSEVCPTGAIKKILPEDKVSTQVGHAVWVKSNCIPLTDGQSCGNCAKHCPVGAIEMIPSDPNDEQSIRIPMINETRCIGCGACENLCPARPFSAIKVEGHEEHKEI